MSRPSDAAGRLARAVLYEGYNLYPYRPTSLKNQYRWTFGTLGPEGSREVREDGLSSFNQTECLVRVAPAGTTLEVVVRFLQLAVREAVPSTDGRPPAAPWDEALEREVRLPPWSLGGRETDSGAATLEQPFQFPGEAAGQGEPPLVGRTLAGSVALAVTDLGEGLHRVSVRLENHSPLPAADPARGPAEAAHEVLLRALGAAHTVLCVVPGQLVSAQDPPAALRLQSAACQNLGLWPVLLDDSLILAAPIILPDHPALAPESPGDLFDATEIDEILALRIHTLTEAERQAAAATDGRTRELLERTAGLTEEALRALHGRLASGVGPGSQVRLLPRRRPGEALTDAFDGVLAGRTATVRSIERDQDGTAYVSVTVDDDPGVDLGVQGFPGHRFFYRLDEVEGCEEESR